MILATCSTIAAILANATGGETIQLNGACPPVTITKTYSTRVVVDATKAKVSGLRIKGGGNITWRGGVIMAARGAFAVGVDGYGVLLSKATNVTIENAKLTAAKKAIVLDGAKLVVIANNTFDAVGEDGIIINASSSLNIITNSFKNTIGSAAICTFLNGTTSSLSQRDCLTRGGNWVDGFHPDAIQMRNGVTGVLIAYNTVLGPTQGITQMDTTGDAAMQRVTIRGNITRTSRSHPITLGNCISCRIEGNDVARDVGSTVKTQIIPGLAVACGNRVQDVQLGTKPCIA